MSSHSMACALSIGIMAAIYLTEYGTGWLRSQPADVDLLLVEAASHSYDNAGRLSAMTGVPAYLGWAGHEWLWRGDNTLPF